MNKKAEVFMSNLTRYVLTPVAEIYEYSWGASFSAQYVKEKFEQFISSYREYPEEVPNFCSMSVEELKNFGFMPWSGGSLMLIPLYLKEILPQDLIVESIFGDKVKLSEADNDNRCGVLAYGIRLPKN